MLWIRWSILRFVSWLVGMRKIVPPFSVVAASRGKMLYASYAILSLGECDCPECQAARAKSPAESGDWPMPHVNDMIR